MTDILTGPGMPEPLEYVSGIHFEDWWEFEEVLDPSVPADLIEIFEAMEWEAALAEPPQKPLSGPKKAAVSVPVVSREACGLKPPTSRSRIPEKRGSTGHWEGPHMGSFPHTSCATKVRGIQKFHMEVRGWSDIAYTAIYCPHGQIFVGRWWGIRTAANGTNVGNNTHYAFCFLGGEGDPFTPEAKRALRYAFELARTDGGAGAERKAHRDHKPTKCPGDEITEFIHSWPEDPVTPGPAPDPGGFLMALTDKQQTEILDKTRELHTAVFDGYPSHGVPSLRMGVRDIWYSLSGVELSGQPQPIRDFINQVVTERRDSIADLVREVLGLPDDGSEDEKFINWLKSALD